MKVIEVDCDRKAATIELNQEEIDYIFDAHMMVTEDIDNRYDDIAEETDSLEDQAFWITTREQEHDASNEVYLFQLFRYIFRDGKGKIDGGVAEKYMRDTYAGWLRKLRNQRDA